MDHSMMFTMSSWLRSKRKMFQATGIKVKEKPVFFPRNPNVDTKLLEPPKPLLTSMLHIDREAFIVVAYENRVVVAVLAMVNFGNSIIISLETFGPNLVLSFTASFINTVVVILALYGIFAFKPIFVTPNVIAKVSLSSAALFHGMQEDESNNSPCVFYFLWLLISVCLFIWEIHVMFTTTFNIMKEMKLRAYNRPPPSYTQVIADDVSPPTYQQAAERMGKVLTLNAAQLEAVVSTSSSLQIV